MKICNRRKTSKSISIHTHSCLIFSFSSFQSHGILFSSSFVLLFLFLSQRDLIFALFYSTEVQIEKQIKVQMRDMQRLKKMAEHRKRKEKERTRRWKKRIFSIEASDMSIRSIRSIERLRKRKKSVGCSNKIWIFIVLDKYEHLHDLLHRNRLHHTLHDVCHVDHRERTWWYENRSYAHLQRVLLLECQHALVSVTQPPISR